MQEPRLEMCFRHGQLVWLFFLDEQNRLCCRSSPKDEKRWSEVSVLQDSFGGQFVIALGNNDGFYLAATDSENVIRCHLYAKQQWQSSVAAEIHPLIEVNNLSLTVDSLGRIHLLYCLRSGRKNGEWQLIHNYAATGRRHSSVLDNGIGLAEASSWAAVDEIDNLHVIYSDPGLNASGLKHQVFETSAQEWRQMEPIPLLHRENRRPCAVFDKTSNLHLVWISSDGRNFRTIYAQRKNKPWPEGGWTAPVPISNQGSNAYSPYLIITGTTITVLWQQLNGVFHRVSEDLGHNWEPVEKQMAMQNLDQYALNYFFPDTGNTGNGHIGGNTGTGHSGTGNHDLSILKTFSASGPQVTLSTAASLLQSPEGGKGQKKKLPVAIAEKQLPATGFSEVNLSREGKRFLLEYNDTLLTNRLINQTVESQEHQLQALGHEIQVLRDRLKEQKRELNSFRSLSELYRKEAETLKQQLRFLEEKEALTKAMLTEKIECCSRTEGILEETNKSNILLQAENHKIKEQLARYENFVGDHQEVTIKPPVGKKPSVCKEPVGESRQEPNKLRYKMISTADYEEE